MVVMNSHVVFWVVTPCSLVFIILFTCGLFNDALHTASLPERI